MGSEGKNGLFWPNKYQIPLALQAYAAKYLRPWTEIEEESVLTSAVDFSF